MAAPATICSGVPSDPQQPVRAVRQLDFAQHLRAIGKGPDDEERPSTGPDVDLAVGQHGRRPLQRAERLFPQFVPRFDVETRGVARRCRSGTRAFRRAGGTSSRIGVPVTAHLVDVISPRSEPSMRRSSPISLPSRFSSPCETITSLPRTTTPVLMARLAAGKLHSVSPVCGLMAWTPPLPSPAESAFACRRWW